jgi:hypothetical protein
MIHIIKERATRRQIVDMLEMLESYIKLAVDVEREILAGGGALHADCEAEPLEDGSQQQDIWGADWVPETQVVRFEAPINIRSRQNNPSMEILGPQLREKVKGIAEDLLREQ